MKEDDPNYPYWDNKDAYWHKADLQKKYKIQMDTGDYTPLERITKKEPIFDLHFNEEGANVINVKKYY